MTGARPVPRPAGSARPLPIALAVAAGGLCALVAGLPPRTIAALVAGPAAWLVAWRRPAAIAVALLVVVLFQDVLVRAGPASLRYADEALLLLGLAAVVARAAAGRGPARTSIDVPLLAFGLVALAAALHRAVPPLVAALGVLAVIKAPLAYVLFARWGRADGAVRDAAAEGATAEVGAADGAAVGAGEPRADATLRRAVAIALALVSALAAIGVAQRLGGWWAFALTGQGPHFAVWHGSKAPSLFDHHNALGHVCVLGGALALAWAWAHRGRPRRLGALAAACCAAGLLASASRESLLAAVAALVAAAVVLRSRRLLGWALVAGGLLVVGGAIVYAASPVLRAEVARRGAGVVEGIRLYRMGYTDWAFRGEYRVYVVLKSLEVLRDHLWLGTGPGRFGGQVALLFPSPVYAAYRFLPLDGVHAPLDVFWSRLLTEFGVLGAAAYLATLGAMVRPLVAAIGRPAGPAAVRALALGALMAAAAIAVVAAFSPALEDPLVAVTWGAWAGLAAGGAPRRPAPAA